MLYKIQIEGDSPEIEANDKTNALIALGHFIKQYPDKKITLTYNGHKHVSTPTTESR